MQQKTDNRLCLRPAVEEDTPVLLELVRELAEYERMLSQFTATQEDLRSWIFRHHAAEVLLAEWEGQVVGFAVYMLRFSTFMGAPVLYLEEMYVRPDFRRHGIGGSLFHRLAEMGRERGCKRMEWACHKWSAPTIHFYQNLGAKLQESWALFQYKL